MSEEFRLCQSKSFILSYRKKTKQMVNHMGILKNGIGTSLLAAAQSYQRIV